jgi:hypothetical protein
MPARVDRYAPADELLTPVWSPLALCGRAWTAMADDSADHTGQVVERPEAPVCRRCLAVIDKACPTPTPDSHIALVEDGEDSPRVERSLSHRARPRLGGR